MHLLSADGFGTQRSLLLLAWAKPWPMRTGWTEAKENHTGRAGKTVWALGERAKGRAREGEKRGDLIGRGSIKPSYDLMEEQISETNLSAGWRSAWNPELLRPHLTGLGCLYRGWLRVQPQNRGPILWKDRIKILPLSNQSAKNFDGFRRLRGFCPGARPPS